MVVRVISEGKRRQEPKIRVEDHGTMPCRGVDFRMEIPEDMTTYEAQARMLRELADRIVKDKATLYSLDIEFGTDFAECRFYTIVSSDSEE